MRYLPTSPSQMYDRVFRCSVVNVLFITLISFLSLVVFCLLRCDLLIIARPSSNVNTFFKLFFLFFFYFPVIDFIEIYGIIDFVRGKHSSAGMSVRLTRGRSWVRAPLLPFYKGHWRSWERATFALWRPRVRIPYAPL